MAESSTVYCVACQSSHERPVAVAGADECPQAWDDGNKGHDTACDCKACLIDTWHAEVEDLRDDLRRCDQHRQMLQGQQAESLESVRQAWAEVTRLREVIHAHRTARRYNPRAPWVDARLWDATGEGVDSAS